LRNTSGRQIDMGSDVFCFVISNKCQTSMFVVVIILRILVSWKSTIYYGEL